MAGGGQPPRYNLIKPGTMICCLLLSANLEIHPTQLFRQQLQWQQDNFLESVQRKNFVLKYALFVFLSITQLQFKIGFIFYYTIQGLITKVTNHNSSSVVYLFDFLWRLEDLDTNSIVIVKRVYKILRR